jgi:hypothetical protein
MYNDAVLFFTGVDLHITDTNPKTIDETDDVTISVPNGNVKMAAERIYAHFTNANERSPAIANDGFPVFLDYNYQFYKTNDLDHGRIENRLYFLVSDVSWLIRNCRQKPHKHCILRAQIVTQNQLSLILFPYLVRASFLIVSIFKV